MSRSWLGIRDGGQSPSVVIARQTTISLEAYWGLLDNYGLMALMLPPGCLTSSGSTSNLFLYAKFLPFTFFVFLTDFFFPLVLFNFILTTGHTLITEILYCIYFLKCKYPV